MSDLPAAAQRRMSELGVSTLTALYQTVPDDGRRASYETVRKILRGLQPTARDPRVIHTLAIMLAMPETAVTRALDAPRSFGEWRLPPRAQRLDPRERQVVMSVIDALIRARKEGDDGLMDSMDGATVQLDRRLEDQS